MAPSKGGIAAWYNKFADFNIESLFVRKREPGPPRSIFINQQLPHDYYDKRGRVKKEHVFVTNQVVTSKYTLITFVPRNLLEQYRRIANMYVFLFLVVLPVLHPRHRLLYAITFNSYSHPNSLPSSFFTAIAILQFFPLFSTISPGLVLLPIIVILLATAIKDGYEDFKRHQSDTQVNFSQVRVLNGGGWTNPNPMKRKGRKFSMAFLTRLWEARKHRKQAQKNPSSDAGLVQTAVSPSNLDGHLERPTLEYDYNHKHPSSRRHSLLHHATDDDDHFLPHWKRTNWEDIRVGDFVKMVDGDHVPADILICATSEDENICYVETKNLDGETNLKSRSAVPELTHFRNAEACANANNSFRIDLDRPDSHMYKLNGAVTTSQGKYPMDLQTVLLRGTVLRNTSWVIGVVLFTGLDTKIVLNAGGTPSKRSKVERQMNPQV